MLSNSLNVFLFLRFLGNCSLFVVTHSELILCVCVCVCVCVGVRVCVSVCGSQTCGCLSTYTISRSVGLPRVLYCEVFFVCLDWSLVFVPSYPSLLHSILALSAPVYKHTISCQEQGVLM